MPQWNYMTYMKSYLDSYDANNDSYFTFGGGFHADLQVTKWFAIETGLFYNPKGMVVRKSPLKNLRLNYVNIPLSLRFSLPVSKKVKIDYLAGIYFLKLLNVTYGQKRLSSPGNFETSLVSFMIGHGITCQLTDDVSLFSNIRLDVSMQDAEKIKLNLYGNELSKTQHLAIALALGIKFNIPLTTPTLVDKSAKNGNKSQEEKLRQSTPRYKKN